MKWHEHALDAEVLPGQPCSTRGRDQLNAELHNRDYNRKGAMSQKSSPDISSMPPQASRPIPLSACPNVEPLQAVTRAPVFPAQLHQQIIQEVGRLPADAFRFSSMTLRTLLSLSQVSKAIHSYTEPVLYRHVTVTQTNVLQLSALSDTLYNGAFRPPQGPLASHVESFLIMLPLMGPEQTPHDAAAAHTSLRSIMLWIAPYVQRVLSSNGTMRFKEEMREILERMPALRTLGYGIGQGATRFPMAIRVRRLILSLSDIFETDHLVKAVASTAVEEIVVFLFLYHQSVSVLPVLVRGLVMNCKCLRRIVLISASERIWFSKTPVGATAPQVLLRLFRGDPSMKNFEGMVQAARVPVGVTDFIHWSFNAVWSGAVWELETIPVDKWPPWK
ncbi:hypothetical protein FRB96_004020 [Tulasnella sp. 330]|nr:hypothetical protein FRB96_004020 [Tulasnella sp. 330]